MFDRLRSRRAVVVAASALALAAVLASARNSAPARAADPPTPLHLLYTFGSLPSADQVGQAADVAAAVRVGGSVYADASVYVVDRDWHRVQQVSPDGRLLAAWGGFGTADGRFVRPHSLAVASDGTVYVADATDRIQRFTAEGGYLGSVRRAVSDLAADPAGDVWALTWNLMDWLNPNGGLRTRWRPGPSDVALPIAADVAPDGAVVLATGTGLVGHWDREGRNLDDTLRVEPTLPGVDVSCDDPADALPVERACDSFVDVAAAGDASILALETFAPAGGQRWPMVHRYTRAGQRIERFGSGPNLLPFGTVPGWTALDALPVGDGDDDAAVVVGGSGEGAPALHFVFDPSGVHRRGWGRRQPAVDEIGPGTWLAALPTGGVLVGSPGSGSRPARSLKFDGDGRFLSWSPLPPGPSAVAPDGTAYVARPEGITAMRPDGTTQTWTAGGRDVAVGPDGRVYVVADGVQIFDAAGTRLGELARGETPAEIVGICGPIAVAVAPAGDIYVVDGCGWLDTDGRLAVKRYAAAGEFVASWAVPWLDRPGNCYAPCYASMGLGGVVVGTDGRLYLGETLQKRIYVFDADGHVEASLRVDTSPMPSGLALTPFDIAAGVDGKLYVSTGEAAQVRVYGPEPAPAWRLEGYPNAWLAGPPAVIAETAAIDLDWRADPPLPGLPEHDFSLRFERTLSLAPGRYNVTLRTLGGGARLWLDDRLVVDASGEPGVARTFAVDIGPDDHRVTLEFRDDAAALPGAIRLHIVPLDPARTVYLPLALRGEADVALVARVAGRPGRRDWQAAASPDGSRLVYVSEDSAAGTSELWRVRRDAQGWHESALPLPGLRAVERPSFVPSAYPDAQTAVLLAGQSSTDGAWDLYTVDIETGQARNLTGWYPPDQARPDERRPALSPDGTRLAFDVEIDGNRDIYLSGWSYAIWPEHRLTDHPARDVFPAWSADGSSLAFRSERDGNSELYMLDPRRAVEPRVQVPLRLTDDPAHDGYPGFAPDGTLVFQSDRGGRPQPYRLDLVTGRTAGFGIEALEAVTPNLGPDGRSLLIGLDRGGGLDIYATDFPGGAGPVGDP